MFIEPRAPKEPLRSSGARYSLSLENTLRSYGALAVLLWIGYKHFAALRPGPILSANFRVRTLVSFSKTIYLLAHKTQRRSSYTNAL
jgi:hypothetical protein